MINRPYFVLNIIEITYEIIKLVRLTYVFIIFRPSMNTYNTSSPRVIGVLIDIYRYCLTRVLKKYFHINSGNENETLSILVPGILTFESNTLWMDI